MEDGVQRLGLAGGRRSFLSFRPRRTTNIFLFNGDPEASGQHDAGLRQAVLGASLLERGILFFNELDARILDSSGQCVQPKIT